MKRTILASLLAAIAVSASAQNVITFDNDYLYFVPGEFTTSGKAVPYLIKYDENDPYNDNMLAIQILDDNFEVKKEISLTEFNAKFGDEYSGAQAIYDYYDVDNNNNPEDLYMKITQSLFNDDDKWELVYFKRDPNGKYYSGTFTVINEDGDVISEFYADESFDLYRFNNNYYLSYNNPKIEKYCFALIDKTANAIKEVKELPVNMMTVSGSTMNVEIPSNFGEGSVSVFNMAGQQVAAQNIDKEMHSVTVDIQSLPKGVYSVTLNGNRHKALNQKVLIK